MSSSSVRHAELHLRWADRALFIWLYRRCPRILDAIAIVRPETVVRWHRMGFAAYWRWKSRPLGGRPRIDKELRDLMRRMSFENPLWGAPKIHGELLPSGGAAGRSRLDRVWCRQGSHGVCNRIATAVSVLDPLHIRRFPRP